MATITSFEDLECWKTSRHLTVQIYASCSSLRDFGFRDQIQRAAVSIMNNIAE
jgi:four helix bundle protein